jgi:hypothetical protein
MLFGVSTTELQVFVAAAATLALVAIGASWIPAHAATKASPMAIAKY